MKGYHLKLSPAGEWELSREGQDFSLVTWRHAGHRTLRQRAVRRLALAKGLMVYEGPRDER